MIKFNELVMDKNLMEMVEKVDMMCEYEDNMELIIEIASHRGLTAKDMTQTKIDELEKEVIENTTEDRAIRAYRRY